MVHYVNSYSESVIVLVLMKSQKNLSPYAVEIVLSIFFKLRLYVVDLGIQALGYLSFCIEKII